jgi:threonine/homoserine/homoserine lactone efflux protein
MKHFNAIIIGTGLPGPSLAARFARGQDSRHRGLDLVAGAALIPAIRALNL